MHFASTSVLSPCFRGNVHVVEAAVQACLVQIIQLFIKQAFRLIETQVSRQVQKDAGVVDQDSPS